MLVRDGQNQWDGMRRTGLTARDLNEALRLERPTPDISKVQFAPSERNGEISLVPAQHGPRLVDVTVAEGVQTVRIALDCAPETTRQGRTVIHQGGLGRRMRP